MHTEKTEGTWWGTPKLAPGFRIRIRIRIRIRMDPH
jgi:hypothetical protein